MKKKKEKLITINTKALLQNTKVTTREEETSVQHYIYIYIYINSLQEPRKIKHNKKKK